MGQWKLKKKRFGFIKCVDKVDSEDWEADIWNTDPFIGLTKGAMSAIVNYITWDEI